MQEKEYIMAVLCELKIPSHGITIRHHLASLVKRLGPKRLGAVTSRAEMVWCRYVRLPITKAWGTLITSSQSNCAQLNDH